MTHHLPPVIVACICAIALVFGLIRIGVSLVLTLQAIGAFDLETFREPVMEVQEFLSVQNGHALIPLSPLSYFAVIAFMGGCLVFGAIFSWLRKPWGYRLLVIYLSAHAGLFVNFQTINPKINILIGGIILSIILVLSNPRRPFKGRSQNINGSQS